MWGQFSQTPILIHLDILRIVDREEFEGVQGNQDRSNVGVYLGVVEPDNATMKNSLAKHFDIQYVRNIFSIK